MYRRPCFQHVQYDIYIPNFFCFGNVGFSSKHPFINLLTKSVFPKDTLSHLHRKQLSAERAVHTAFSDVLSRTRMVKTFIASVRGGENGSICLIAAYLCHFCMYTSYILFVDPLHDNIVMVVAFEERPDVCRRCLILCIPAIVISSSVGVSVFVLLG